MSGEQVLPEGFAALEPFVDRWAVARSDQRAALRIASSPEEREAFFAAGNKLCDAALDTLDKRPLAELSPAEKRLMDLMLSLAHVAMAVEIQGPDEAKSAPWRERMRISRSAADW